MPIHYLLLCLSRSWLKCLGALTLTCGRYGDKAPITAAGRCLGFTWMIVGLIIFGIFNAVFTSALTSANVKDVVLTPRYASQVDGNLNSPEILPICALGGYEEGILASYGIDAADIRKGDMDTCYKLLNASTSPPTKANHVRAEEAPMDMPLTA